MKGIIHQPGKQDPLDLWHSGKQQQRSGHVGIHPLFRQHSQRYAPGPAMPLAGMPLARTASYSYRAEFLFTPQ